MGAHQIQLTKMTKKEHMSEDEDADLIAFQAEHFLSIDDNKHLRVWALESRNDKSTKYERIIQDQAQEHQQLLNNTPSIINYFKRSVLKPFSIYSFQVSHKKDKKVLTEYKVKDPQQYKFFMDLLQILDLSQEQIKNVESINMVYDQYVGIYALQVITESHIIIQYSQDESQTMRKFT